MTIRQIQPESPLLRIEPTGAIRVGNSQVLLELVIGAFEEGATAEEIAQRYPTVGLPAIYAAITYYLRHPDEMREYLSEREQQAVEVRSRIEAEQGDLSAIRARLLARRPP
jgi:uncharacterized protein (DUF433 family)